MDQDIEGIHLYPKKGKKIGVLAKTALVKLSKKYDLEISYSHSIYRDMGDC